MYVAFNPLLTAFSLNNLNSYETSTTIFEFERLG
jgi:hypothetical protein